MEYSALECLKIERHGPVGWLINNRPDQLNAMSARMRDEFAVAWKELDADPDVRVIVHTGDGRAFQTGVDVTEIATDGLGMPRYRESVENGICTSRRGTSKYGSRSLPPSTGSARAAGSTGSPTPTSLSPRPMPSFLILTCLSVKWCPSRPSDSSGRSRSRQ